MAWTPWHFLVVAISGWVNREQQEVIDYLREEITGRAVDFFENFSEPSDPAEAK